MGRVVVQVVISVLVALLITGATLFVEGEGVVASIPRAGGASGTAFVSGFPTPYATLFGCCSCGIGGHSSYTHTPS